MVSNTADARLETYVIAGDRGWGVMCMNGAAAHLIGKSEEIIVMGFELTDQIIPAEMALVDGDNRLVRWLAEEAFAPAHRLQRRPFENGRRETGPGRAAHSGAALSVSTRGTVPSCFWVSSTAAGPSGGRGKALKSLCPRCRWRLSRQGLA